MFHNRKHKTEGSALSMRAAAEHTGSSKATVSFPANKSQTVQRYTEGNYFNTDFRFSEDLRMAVEANKAKLFLTEIGVPVGEPALKEVFRDNEHRIFKIGIDYIQDCGEYAGVLMRQMAKTRKGHLQVTNADVKPSQVDFKNNFNDIIPTSDPTPGVGEAFYVYNDPADELFGVKDGHFNFHWGAVVGKSGDDVITAEADSRATEMWFQMYNTSKFKQSFKDHWFTKDKLAETAKAFQVKFVPR